MEIQKVKHFIKFCALCAYCDLLSGLTNEELICLLEECLQLVMALLVFDTDIQRIIYIKFGFIYESSQQVTKAIESYKKSLSCTIGYRDVEMLVYQRLASIYQSLRKYHEAIKYDKKCLSIAMEIGDREEEANSYGNLGNTYSLLGKYHEAIIYQKKSLDVAMEIGDRHGEKEAYGSLGFAYQSLGKYHKAIEYYERLLRFNTEIGDRKGEGRAYGNLGVSYRLLGKYHKAIECQETFLGVAMEIGDRHGEGAACGGLGNTKQSLGKYDEAIKYHKKCLSISREVGDRQGEGTSFGNLGNTYQSLGKCHEAFECYKKNLGIAMEIGDRQGEANSYGNLGIIYELLGKYHKAIVYYQKLLSIATEIGDRNGEESAYGGLGNVHQLLGKYHEAIGYYRKRLSIAMEIGDRHGEGHSYGGLGNTYRLLGKYHEARKYHEKCLSIATEIGDTQGKGKAHHNIGICYQFKTDEDDDNGDHLTKSKEHLKESIQCFEELFDDLKDKDQLKISIVDTFVKSYKTLSESYIRTAQMEEALLVSERGRARALGDLLSLKYSMNEETASKSGSLKLTDVDEIMMLNFCILFYDVSMLQKKVQIWALAHRNPLFCVCSEIKNVESTSAMDENEYDEELIDNLVENSYYKMKVREGVECEDRSLGILDCENQDKVEVPASTQVTKRETTKRNEIGKKVFQSRCIYEDDDDEKPLELLFETLVAPVQHKLMRDEIVIIPDGPLFMVPFAALQDPETGKFLSEIKRIRLAPSLTTLKILQTSSDEQHYMSGALIVGNPEIGIVKYGGKERSFTDLPGAEYEAREISKLLEVDPLTGRQATKEAIVQKLHDGVSVIHFAAHGSANGQILLAPSVTTNSIPDEHDYILTMEEAQESGLRAQLVVLSCCHSGRGKIKSEGVVGMTRAFLAAGARAVVASLWAIDDNATMVFMLKFYSHLKKGESASKSLQHTMEEMRETEKYKEPRYWAAFFLIGDDVTISVKPCETTF